MSMVKINNHYLTGLIKPSYTLQNLVEIKKFLEDHGTLKFAIKENGLYSAMTTEQKESISGYTYTWIRDTIMITNYQRETGNFHIVEKTLDALRNYFYKQRHRFINIIEGNADKNDPMQRPHIRFNGDTLEEIDQKWAHAQNDALGYALWMVFKVANENRYSWNSIDHEVYPLFPLYFEAIEYWHDEDSGHWEEARKVQSSSIGVVVAALKEMKKFITLNPAASFEYKKRKITIEQLQYLIEQGEKQLQEFLPYESPPQRDADGALLFLLYPLEVIEEKQAQKVLNTVLTHLQGDYGIKRYKGDSYWCANYKKLLKEEDRTVDFSENMEQRDRMLIPDTEAQWCIFNPIVSVIYGKRYVKTQKAQNLEAQTYYFNRSLGQLTPESCVLGAGKCPEAYYIEDSANGIYIHNDHVPLGWAQANLGVALEYMKRSLAV